MSVWDEVIARLHRPDAVEVGRYVVTSVSPLALDRIDGDGYLEEDDEDFTLSDGVRRIRKTGGLVPGTVVLVHECRGEYVAVDALTSRPDSDLDGPVVVPPAYTELTETADPAAPAANRARLYARDDGAGLTELVARFPTGSMRVLERDGGLGGGFRHVQTPPSQAVAVAGAISTNTYLLTSTGIVVVGNATTGGAILSFDPADFAQEGRLTRVRLKLSAIVNAVAPGVSFTASLCPVTTIGGASGAAPFVSAIGAAVATVTIPSASLVAFGKVTQTADFAAPAAGIYAIAITISGTQVANSQVAVLPRLLAGAV